MNKQELKEQVEDYLAIEGVHDARVALETVLRYIDQLNEPEMTEEQAWNKIGEAYADSEKGRLMNAKKIFDNGLEMQGVINTVMFKLKKSNDDRTFEEFVIDSIKKTELPVIPQFVADHIKYFKEDTLTLGDALDTHYEDNRKMHTWLYENIEARNDEVFARAWLDGCTIEQPKTYRFTLNAFHEIDVTAASFEEAQKNADVMWNQYFVRQRDFGEAEFEGEVNEDGDLNG